MIALGLLPKHRNPPFYFYFDQANGSLSSGAGFNAFFGPGAAVTSPSEFSLIRFDTKSGRREAKVGKFNIGGAKSGVMDKDRIAFQYDQLAPGVFKVSPTAPLSPGEYGFLYSVSSSGMGMASGGNMMARAFDFSIVNSRALASSLTINAPSLALRPSRAIAPPNPAFAGVAKLVDAPDLGSGIERCGGSSPFARTSFAKARSLGDMRPRRIPEG